jgi:DNA-directed RNA polymerase specialized sigma24 family protein
VREKWQLDGASFHHLLAVLDPDPESAGRAYELLRKKLVVFFRTRCSFEPEALADEVLDRVARRLAEGEPVRDLSSYCRGVALNVSREARRGKPLASLAGVDPPAPVASEEEPLDEPLRQCLAELGPGDRELVIRYYEGDGRRRIENRERLAVARGLSPNALRIRVHRLRSDLEACVAQRRQAAAMKSFGSSGH